MLTVQEIQAVNFEKAVFGGYDMKAVDEFLEHITEDYAAMQKENAALKSKMKVLVDKIEEYRSVEDGMRRALVSAQSIAQETLDKSKTEAEQLLFNARTEAETRIENYRMQIAAETKKLEEAKAKNAEFAAQLTAVYEEQLKSLVALSASDILETEPAFPTEPISMTTETVESAEPLESTQQFDIHDHTAETDGSASEGKKESRFKITEVSLASSDDSSAEATDKPHFDFGELKFGADYAPTEDR
jgi:cell division initiation protein